MGVQFPASWASQRPTLMGHRACPAPATVQHYRIPSSPSYAAGSSVTSLVHMRAGQHSAQVTQLIRGGARTGSPEPVHIEERAFPAGVGNCRVPGSGWGQGQVGKGLGQRAAGSG